MGKRHIRVYISLVKGFILVRGIYRTLIRKVNRNTLWKGEMDEINTFTFERVPAEGRGGITIIIE